MLEHSRGTQKKVAVRDQIQRVAVKITGRVQGVGFRPFVYGLACRLMLQGFVKNLHDRVYIEVQGWSHDIQRFLDEIKQRPPALSRIERLECQSLALDLVSSSQSSFQMEASGDAQGGKLFIPADLATCDDCLAELNNPLERRYQYPFLSCVSCGPRFSILQQLPYDRERTSMKEFPLCKDCQSEFYDPCDRRFHAQTTACEICGPKIALQCENPEDGMSPASQIAQVARAASAMMRGECVAVKGIGGYHLVCDATKRDAVRKIRQSKRRDEKPLAIMVSNQDSAFKYCEISTEELRLLKSEARPIVLLRKRNGAEISHEISLSSPFLGVMLPYTPLHHLLLQEMNGTPLVMTSANESGRPMAYEDACIGNELMSIADLFLTHDRRIETRCDDSVVRVADPDGVAIEILVRRSRGFAPEPVALPFELDVPLLALGAQLKNTFAFGAEKLAVLSHHMGDLDEMATYESYVGAIEHYEALMGLQPQVLVHDYHPDYLSTHYAIERSKKLGLRAVKVQHHHAHIASCMADNGLSQSEKVIGVAFDGTGLGLDGKIWGGEFFTGNYLNFERVAHLRNVAMPGGEKAVREPWRMAFAHLHQSGLDPMHASLGTSHEASSTLRQMIERGLNCPMTSSMGRLFDAVAALLGVRLRASFEGQAAMELEALALRAPPGLQRVYRMPLSREKSGEPFQIDTVPMMHEIVEDLKQGLTGSEIAGRFHSSLIQMIVRVCEELRRESGLNKVVLSGGVFMNGILLSGAVRTLKSRDFQVFFHRQVPPNDGGISLGQLAIAAALLKKEKEDVFGSPGKTGGALPGT